MSLSSLSASLKISLGWSATKTRKGAEPAKHEQTVIRTLSYGTAKQPTSAGGADEIVWDVRYISANGGETLDLSAALTNVCRDPSITLVRVKGIVFNLLGDGETIGPSGSEITGTLCTGVQIGGAATNPWKGFFGTTASKHDIISEGAGGIYLAASGGPKGVGLSSGMNDQLLINNLDTAITGVLGIGFIGGAS